MSAPVLQCPVGVLTVRDLDNKPFLGEFENREVIVCGAVTTLRSVVNKLIFTLNDGFDSIPVVVPANDAENPHLWVGRSVRVLGTPSIFKDDAQLKAKKLTFVEFVEQLAFWTDLQVLWTPKIMESQRIASHNFPLAGASQPNDQCPCVCHASGDLGGDHPVCGPGPVAPWPRLFCRFVQVAKVLVHRFPEAEDHEIETAMGNKQRKCTLPLRCVTRCALAFAKAEGEGEASGSSPR